MEELIRAAILGLVQGLTEFLPVSSSGHLILVPALFRWPDQGLAFDVGLHLGTLLAILAYFWRDWYGMLSGGLRDVRSHSLRVASYGPESRLLLLLALGSIPAAIVGLLLDSWIEENVRQPWLVAIMLAVMGTVMLVADRRSRLERTSSEVGVMDILFIGLAQATALIPGVSRSGATITMGLFRHLTRNDAARIAFLLGTPAFVGAGALKASDLLSNKDISAGPLIVGFATSAVVGFLAIHLLLRYLRTRSLVPFVIYRYGAAVVTLVIALLRVA